MILILGMIPKIVFLSFKGRDGLPGIPGIPGADGPKGKNIGLT